MIGKEDQPGYFVTVDLEDYQRLKDIEDRISDVVLCLDSTLDTLKTFMEMHKLHFADRGKSELRKDLTTPQTTVVDNLLFVLKEKQREVAYARKKTEGMLSKAQNTRALVGRAPFPFHHSGY